MLPLSKIQNFLSYLLRRSFLKETEDYNVGKSIVRATDGVLRRDAHGLQERYKNIGIIGVGKNRF